MSTHERSLSRFSRRSLLIGGGAAALALAMPRDGSARYPTPRPYLHAEWLADAGWLKAHLDEVKVVALTPADEFEAGHIPGAAQVDWPELVMAHTTPDAIATWQAALQMRLRELNVTPADTVVVYDGGTFLAARLWWALDALGHADVRILNGGLTAWRAANGELETGPAQIEAAADTYAATLNAKRMATQGEVMMAIGNPDVVLLDARDPDEFRNGHIPGAINYPFLLNAEEGPVRVMKSDDLLAAAYFALGIRQGQRVIAYCSSGTRSCASSFALRLIGYPDVRLYSGSWDEWKANPYFPREVGSGGTSEIISSAPQSPHSCARCSFESS